MSAQRPAAEPRVWRNLWLVFALICLAVAALHVLTILAFDETGRTSITVPLALGFGLPAVAYLLGWLVARIGR